MLGLRGATRIAIYSESVGEEMKVLSLEEIEALYMFGLTGPLSLKRLLHTAREYHRLREALEKISISASLELSPEAEKYGDYESIASEIADFWHEQSSYKLNIAREALKEESEGE